MSDEFQNPWDEGGSRYPDWDRNAWADGSDAVGQPAKGGDKIKLVLPEPPTIEQEQNTYCWIAAFKSWIDLGLSSINYSVSQDDIYNMFKDKKDSNGNNILTEAGALIAKEENWQTVSSFFGANRTQYFRPENGHAGLNAAFLLEKLKLRGKKQGSGYIMVAENEPGSAYKHAFIVYGIEGPQPSGYTHWMFMNPDGGVLDHTPIARSPRWNQEDKEKRGWDIGRDSQFWLAWYQT